MVNKLVYLILLSLVCHVGSVFGQEINLSVDVEPKSGSLDDSFVMSVRVDGTAETEYPILEGGEDFDVTVIGPQTSIQVVNGQVSQSIVFHYRLTPKKEGTLSTPKTTLKVNGMSFTKDGPPVLVSKSANINGAAQNKEIFVKQEVDADTIYVGQQVVNTVQVFSRAEPVEFNVEPYSYDGFWAQDLGKIEKGGNTIDGYRYTTVRVRKSLFPLRVGDFTLPARKIKLKVRQRVKKQGNPFDLFGMDPFNDRIFDDFFGGSIVEKVANSSEVPLKVISLPQLPADPSLFLVTPTIVGPTSLTLEYSDQQIKFGESKTVELTLRSEGNINPVASLPITQSTIKTYEENPKVNQYEVAGKLVTEKTFRISIVPQVGGEIKVGSPKILFFNPERKEYEVAQAPDIKFFVEGGPSKIPPAPSVVPKVKVDATSDKELDPQLSYVEETRTQKFFRRVSVEYILIGILSLGLFAVLVNLMVIILKRRNSKKALFARIDTSTSPTDLVNIYREILSGILDCSTTGLTSENLKALVRSRIKDERLTFRLQSILDELDTLNFGNVSKDHNVLSSLKEKIKEVV